MPSQFFGLTIASSGLSAYQAALNTTANNISNEQTKGYSRQAANLSASDALRVNAKYGSMGSGVTVNSIKQIRSEYYDTKYWQNQASLGLYETKLGYLEQIENYFIDDDTEKGFSTILNKMFNSLDTLTHPAGDTNVRQQFISDAQSFMTYFNSVATGLGQIQDSVNEEIKSTVENINAIGKKISLLNKQINVIEVQGGYANELRDQRALLIDELSSIVPTEVSEVPVTNSKHPDMQTGANYYTVKINGQKFVDTYEYSELTCVARKNTINQSDREGMYEIVWADTGNSFKAGSDSSSGSLKALFDIRDGNNSENFRGSIKGVTAGTITISNPSITNVNAMTMPAEGVLTIDGKNYNYTDFTFTTDADGNVVDEWTSTEGSHVIKELVVGNEYTMTETKPADGYVTAESITFTVEDTSEVQKVEMKDDVTKVQISKTDISGKELPGAKLTILDKDGKTVESWTSEEKPHYIEMLPIGEYTLREETAPDGYLVAEGVKFTVKDTGEIQKVVMKDEVKPTETPTETPEETPETPETTSTPETKDTEATKTSTSPKTGDNTPILFWILLAGVGMAGVGGTVILRKKKKK